MADYPGREEAINEWIRQTGCPEAVRESVTVKFKRLKMTAEQIRSNMMYILSRGAVHTHTGGGS